MKRAIFRLSNIEQNIEHELFPTPIQPATLRFEPGELMLVATPKIQAPPATGEYILAFTVGEYLRDRASAGGELFGRPEWRHVYAIASVQEIEPFALKDVVSAAGARGEQVRQRYRGQTQHHRIIRHIQPEDEGLFLGLIQPRRTTWSATATMHRNRQHAARRIADQLSESDVIAKLKNLDRQNRDLAPASSMVGSSQRRNAEFVELLKTLYRDRCQVCGRRSPAPGARTRADVH